MKNTIPFEIFGENQYLKFDIMRLAELETAAGKSIPSIISAGDVGISFALTALPIAMKQHFPRATPQDFVEKIENYLEQGGDLNSILVPIVRAILASGMLGNEVRSRALASVEVQPEQPEE